MNVKTTSTGVLNVEIAPSKYLNIYISVLKYISPVWQTKLLDTTATDTIKCKWLNHTNTKTVPKNK